MYYLKYRPQKIADLDLIDIREGLKRLLLSNRIPHALLFSGPRGAGKTSAARIIAKAVNCEKKTAGFEPCNQCSMCQAITNGTALDLIEIDAASNRGIDDIRNLREKVGLAPAKADYKVYIIDEVHMLTTEAFNALLKTLEEPPSHVIFILCTTEPEKLPRTIISRCLRFNFRKGRVGEIINCLKKVVKGEKLKIENGVLEEIANGVDGSFRDAQKVLEQLSFGRDGIEVGMVRKEMGRSKGCQPEILIELLKKKELKPALSELDRVVEKGVNLKVYIQGLLVLLRNCLLQSVGCADKIVDKENSCQLSKDQAVRLIELLIKAGKEVKKAPIPQLPLELAIVEWCASNHV